MRGEMIGKAGRLEKIYYTDDVAVSIGERKYRRVKARPTAATKVRLDALAARGFGRRPKGRNMGVVYRSPWRFLGALWRTQKLVWGIGIKRRMRKS